MRPSPYRFGLLLPLVLIPLLVITGMSIYQWVKHFFWPDINLMDSHIHTTIFLAIIATVSSFFLCRYLETRSLLASIVESSDDAIVGITMDGIVFSWNRGAERIYGYSAKEVVGRPLSIILPVDRPGDIEHILARIRRGESVEHYETARTRKNGETAYVSLTVSPILNAAGRIIGASSIIRDITNDRQTNIYLENVFENSPDAIGIVDEHGKFKKWNRMAAELYGYSFEELRGKSGFDLYANKVELETMLEQLRREGSVKKREIEMKKKDGSVVPFELSIGMLQDDRGRVLGSVCVARDLSEIKLALTKLKASHEQLCEEIIVRKQAEEEVRRLNRQNKLILDAAGEGIVGLDLLGKVTFINPTGAELTGYRIDELTGKDLHEAIHHSRPDGTHYPVDQCPMHQSLCIGVARRETSEVFWRKDGTRFPAAYASTPILEEERIIGAVVTFRDITERKRVQRELIQYRDHLEDLVKERTAELARTNEHLTREIEERKRAEEALQDSTQKLKLFAYSVAHDLKSPSIGIHGLTQRLDKQSKHVLDEKGKIYCSQILKLSEHIATLVEQINLFIATKETPLFFEQLKLKDLLHMLKDEFSARLSIRPITWIEPESEIVFSADRLCILRVFRNLIDNALKYGGDRLSTIWIDYEESEDAHIFSVSNDGEGLKAADAEKIFGPFQRHEPPKGIEGVGLGLTIVKEIAERHGGKVWIETGSRKRITFNLSVAKNLDS